MSRNQMNTKSSHYLKDKDLFLKELKQFNESKNIPFKTPIVNGIEIDLFLFYSLVQQRGGLNKVNHTDTWDTILRPLKLPSPCVNGSTLLRRLYGTYLEKFERAKGPPGRDDDNDMDDDPRRTSRSGIPRVSFAGAGAYITASGETLRTASTRTVAGPAERLALSLLSPMPNEQDFAVNVCTVLAADHSNRLPLSTTPHILDFLLAHAGVYNHSSLRDTIGRSYYEARGRYPHEFWQKRAGGGGARELADEDKFAGAGAEQPELMVQARAAHNTLLDALLQEGDLDDVLDKAQHVNNEQEVLEDWVTEPSDEDQLFAPELPGGATCVFTQRVLQIASIIRSLSFHEDNVQYLAKNTTLIRFLLLCANSWVGTLRQSGLDSLGNVSTELIIKDPATCLISRHILSTIQTSLVSQDRARVLAALELLNKLAQNEANEDALLRALEAKVYSDVCALLTLRDIMVLVCTLECVYALTALGDRAGEAVARVPGLVHTLVSLVTVEAQSYGPRACILMRVVETVSGPGALAAAEKDSEKQQQQQQSQQQPQPQNQTPVKQVPEPAAPPAAAAAAAAAAPATTPMATIQQSHNQQRTIQENEQFAGAWLRSACEVLPGGDNSECDAADVYRQYVQCCAKMARKGIIAPAHFHRLVRTAFGGTVGPNTVSLSNGETQQVYVGIKLKTAARNNTTAGPSSPILKAQLTNKPAEAKAEVKPQTQHQQPATHPHLSQALESSPSSTTLIKHLLANKVSPAQHQTQVAQRQNQQRVALANNTTVVQQGQNAMELDPEALIKCTTITPGGIASSTPSLPNEKIINAPEEIIVPKDEPVQIQIDEQSQLTIKTAQNKMLADLLEKKSNPPVQVVQMGPQINNAPTIQITETGQIVQVKPDASPVIQINADGNFVSPSNQYYQIKNDQGQLIQIKNDQGQIIHVKNDQGQLNQGQIIQIKNEQPQINQGQIIQIKNEQGQLDQGQIIQIKNDQPQINQGQIIQIKNDQGQIIQLKADQLQSHGQLIQFKNDQGQIIQVKNEPPALVSSQVIQNIVQGQIHQGQIKTEKDQIIDTVINDHSYTEPPNKKVKVEDKREASPQESVSKTAANLYAALAASALEDEDDLVPPKQEPMEVLPQPVIVGTTDNQSVIIQEPILQVQQPTIKMQSSGLQQTLQVHQNTLQMQPAIQMQQPTLQVQQPLLQMQQMDVQNIIASQAGQIILQAEKPITTQTQFMQQSMQLIAAPSSSQGGLSYLTQNLQGNMMQKTIIIVQGPTGGGPLTLTVNNPAGLDEATLNSLIAQATEAITQQQIIQNSGVIQSTQRVLNQPLGTQSVTMVKTALTQNTAQLTPSQQPIITAQPQPHKAQIMNQPQQIVVTQKQPPALISTSSSNPPQLITGNQQILQSNQQLIQGNQILQSNQQILQGNQQILQSNQQILQGNQQILQGGQQIIAVSNNQQIIVNSPMKTNVHRMVQPQKKQVVNVQATQSNIQTDNKTSVIQSSAKLQQPATRQVITRQPVMLGNTKIGDKEMLVTQTVIEKTPTTKQTVTPPPISQASVPPPLSSPHEDTPWVCHWRGCGKTFSSASEVYVHAAGSHCPRAAGGEAPCLWLECDRVPRRTFALLNHLSDKHCTPQALKALHLSRRNSAAEGDKAVVSLGYPPNAALAALNKHATDMFNPRELMHRAELGRTPEQLDENEGPVTKSIRLTAALILRNIVIYSNTGRRQLRSYESHLASIALSSVEASRTIAQVLFDMNNI